MKTFQEFKERAEEALKVRFDIFALKADFETNYPEYQDGLPYNYYSKE